jgi:hypothetical protein
VCPAHLWLGLAPSVLPPCRCRTSRPRERAQVVSARATFLAAAQTTQRPLRLLNGLDRLMLRLDCADLVAGARVGLYRTRVQWRRGFSRKRKAADSQFLVALGLSKLTFAWRFLLVRPRGYLPNKRRKLPRASRTREHYRVPCPLQGPASQPVRATSPYNGRPGLGRNRNIARPAGSPYRRFAPACG